MLELVTLQGSNVVLSPLAHEQLPALLTAANEDRRHFRHLEVPADEVGMRRYLEAAEAERTAGAGLAFAILERAGGRVLGVTRYCGVERWAWPSGHPLRRAGAAPDVVEIGGSWLAASATGRGVHREVSLLLLTHAFEGWRVRRVAFRCDARNEPARRAVEKLGVRFEGVLRAAGIGPDGAVLDLASYSVLDSEWRAVKSGLTRAGLERRAPVG
jgi:RimJ/RimL family protein N-acetyltransferase